MVAKRVLTLGSIEFPAGIRFNGHCENHQAVKNKGFLSAPCAPVLGWLHGIVVIKDTCAIEPFPQVCTSCYKSFSYKGWL